MVGVKKTISMAIVALAVASVVHADMVSVSPLEGGEGRQAAVGGRGDSWQGSDSRQAEGLLGTISDVGWSSIRFLSDVKSQAGDVGWTKPPEVLTDRQSSFTLCLYTLLGLSLCRTAPWVRKLHLGLIPDWYQTGGPYQIGHSFAISPDCLPGVPVFCFLQPEAAGTSMLQPFRWEIVVSLWRRSQYTPAVLASRGPPYVS
jgi:hypothetical protein